MTARSKHLSDRTREFECEEQQLRFEQSRIGAWLMLALIPAGVTLDHFVNPEKFWAFALYRAIADLFVFGVLALHWHPFGQRAPNLLITLWLGAAVVMICQMIFETGGARSSYYAGLILALLAIGILLPLRVKDAALICGGTLAIYAAVCFVEGQGRIDTSSFFNAMYFLALASVIAVTAVHFGHRRRFNEFELRQELKKRNDQLAELDEMKSRFFANVSHELRTPLTLVLAPIQHLLGQSSSSDAARQALQTAETSALRLLRLVNDLLDLVRFENTDAPLREDPLDVSSILRSIVEQSRYLAQAKQLYLSIETPDEPAIVRGDSDAFERIFINIISNAIKFTNANGRIDVQCAIDAEHVTICIRDTGIGIPSQNLAKIFERFQQVDTSMARRAQGLGLGLALVKELVARQSGVIEVASVVDHGTTLTLRFRRAASPICGPERHSNVRRDAISEMHRAAVFQIATAPSFAIETPAATDAGAPKLLLVDDDPTMHAFLASLLNRKFIVSSAYDGEAALAAAELHPPSLMVLDLMIPKTDGLEVCRRLKEHPHLRAIKILLLTARIDEAVKLKAISYGVDDFLTKPFSSLELLTRLNNLQRSAELEAEIRSQNEDLKATLARLHETEAELLQREKLSALGTMAAGLLHEINNPLNYAAMALRLVRTSKTGATAPPPISDWLTDVADGISRVQAIVSDLRTFTVARPQERQQAFSVAEMIKHATRFTASELATYSLSVDAPQNLEGLGDEHRLSQVMVNLLLNAAKACSLLSPPEFGRISVSARRNNERIVISVTDNGVGIAPELLPRLFDPFFTTSAVGAGMGLGLSVSYAIIKQHGGELTVQSEVGKGATFSFSIEACKHQIELARSHDYLQ